MVILLQVLAHVLEYFLNGNVYFFHNPFVDVPYDLLNHFELLKQLFTGLEDVLGEDILLAVDPEVWESFLRRVKNLSEVA